MSIFSSTEAYLAFARSTVLQHAEGGYALDAALQRANADDVADLVQEVVRQVGLNSAVVTRALWHYVALRDLGLTDMTAFQLSVWTAIEPEGVDPDAADQIVLWTDKACAESRKFAAHLAQRTPR